MELLTNNTTDCRVETIVDYERFLELEPEWNRLVERAGITHPFLTHEWLRTWWEAFGEGKEIHIVRATSGGETVALAPLMVSRVKLCGLTFRRLGFIYNVHTPRCDFLVAPGAEAAYGAIWRHLSQHNDRWDLIELAQLPQGSATLDAVGALARSDGYLIGRWNAGESPYVTLRGTWDDYFKMRDRKHRSNVRNRLNRLQRLGEVEFQEIGSPEQSLPALEQGLQIEAKAWKGNAGTAILCHPELYRFYRTLAVRAAERGWLRIYFLSVDGKRIAFDYSLCYGRRLFILKPGYDPQYAPFSPYNSLCYMKLRSAFEAGLAEYDFLGVKDEWKLDWASETRPHYWLYVFRKTFPASLVHFLKFGVSPKLKQHRFYGPLLNLVAGEHREERL